MNRRRKLLMLSGGKTPLLNTTAGAGAAAAYSLRTLNRALIGQDIIEVKRLANSDFDRFKLRASGIPVDQISSFCGASDGVVSWLQDQSGNNRSISQTAESACPIIYESATGIVLRNGKPSLRFTTAHNMVSEAVAALATDDNGFTVFFVSEKVDDNSPRVSQYLTTGNERVFSTITRADTSAEHEFSVQQASDFDGGRRVTLLGEGIHLLSGYWAGEDGFSRAQINENTIVQATASTPTVGSNQTQAIELNSINNGGSKGDGWISEAIIYSHNKESVRSIFHTNILKHYAIP